MKKNYIAPSTQIYTVQVENLLGINSISDERAGAGSADNTVNFGRSGGDWGDEE